MRRLNKYGDTTYTADFSEQKQLSYACNLWQRVYGVETTNQNLIMNAVNLLTARLEAELEDN